MGERPDFEATHGSYWRSISRRRKIAIVAGAAAAATLLVAGALALSSSREPTQDGGGETSRTITPAEETTATKLPVLPGADTADEGAGEPAADAGAASTPAATTYTRAALVSYRREGWLCVACEDGSGERKVVASASGVHALSPDGATLAFVDSATGTLALADVASGAATAVGPALQDSPSWSPDSAWLVYSAPGPKVVRVRRDGVGAAEIFAGSMPSVSVADGTVVGFAPTGEIAVWRNGALTRFRISRTLTGLATDGTMVFFGAMATDGSVLLRVVATDGSGERTLVAAPESDRAVTFGDLSLSHRASQLAYTERSDDGYSRMFSIPIEGGEPVSLCVRRDCYPLRWTADGDGLLFIEGNALQGDPTALMSVLTTGGSRRLLLEGAGR